jgi:hypothetical protein
MAKKKLPTTVGRSTVRRKRKRSRTARMTIATLMTTTAERQCRKPRRRRQRTNRGHSDRVLSMGSLRRAPLAEAADGRPPALQPMMTTTKQHSSTQFS